MSGDGAPKSSFLSQGRDTPGKSIETSDTSADETLFLEAVDTLKAEHIPTEKAEPSFKHHRITNKVVVDFHGLTGEQARVKLKHLITHGSPETEYLVIVGKGIHSSSEGPVLKTLVPNLLRHTHAKKIRSWRWASAKEGGSGALKIRLKRNL